jgi:hypothetical protein
MSNPDTASKRHFVIPFPRLAFILIRRCQCERKARAALTPTVARANAKNKKAEERSSRGLHVEKGKSQKQRRTETGDTSYRLSFRSPSGQAARNSHHCARGGFLFCQGFLGTEHPQNSILLCWHAEALLQSRRLRETPSAVDGLQAFKCKRFRSTRHTVRL